MIGKALIVWFAQLVAIVMLGGLRDKLLSPRVGEKAAHQLGTVSACLVVFIIIFVFLPWLNPPSPVHALALGSFWVALAVAFEFGFFHFSMKVPWSQLLADYNIAKGRLLILLWITVLFAPLICFYIGRI